MAAIKIFVPTDNSMDKVILVNKLARLAMDEDYRLRLINGVAAKAIKYRAMNDAAILRIRKQR